MSSKKSDKIAINSNNLLARRPINIITSQSYGDRKTPRLSPPNYLRSHFYYGMPVYNETRRRSCGNVGSLQRCNSSDTSRLSLSRDAQQPSSGSLLNLRCQSLPPDNEESDQLESLLKTRLSLQSFSHALSNNRPWSSVCYEMDSKKLKSKVKNRPPTPPPSATLPAEISPLFMKPAFVSTKHSRSFDSSSPILGSSASHHSSHQPSHPASSSVFNLGRRSRHSSREKIEEYPLEDTLPVIKES